MTPLNTTNPKFTIWSERKDHIWCELISYNRKNFYAKWLYRMYKTNDTDTNTP